MIIFANVKKMKNNNTDGVMLAQITNHKKVTTYGVVYQIQKRTKTMIIVVITGKDGKWKTVY